MSLEWRVVSGREGSYVTLSWRERGGPPAAEPANKGLGSMLLERTLDDVITRYGQDGFACEWQLAL